MIISNYGQQFAENRHTDRLVHQSSYNPTSHKATTVQTLTRCAQLVCDTHDSLTDEIKFLDNVFNMTNYSLYFIRHNSYRNSEPNVTNTKLTPVTTETITTVQHPRCSQTYHSFATTTGEC